MALDDRVVFNSGWINVVQVYQCSWANLHLLWTSMSPVILLKIYDEIIDNIWNYWWYMMKLLITKHLKIVKYQQHGKKQRLLWIKSMEKT